MSERLLNTALNEIRALQREIQGLKNQLSAVDRRMRALEAETESLTDQQAALQRDTLNLRKQDDVTHGRLQSVNEDVSRLSVSIMDLRDKVTDTRNGQPPSVTDAVTDAKKWDMDRVPEFPRHVAGTSGRGIKYELSDGTVINAGRVKALAAEAAL